MFTNANAHFPKLSGKTYIKSMYDFEKLGRYLVLRLIEILDAQVDVVDVVDVAYVGEVVFTVVVAFPSRQFYLHPLVICMYYIHV